MPSNWPQPPATSDRIRNRRTDAASLHGKPVPDRRWLVSGLIPESSPTLLYGDGGTGKSLLALQLATARVTGTQFFGKPIRKGRVEYITAEDSLDELHRRLADIATAARAPLSDYVGLHLTSLADEDALLAVPEDGRGGALVSTPLYEELKAIVSEGEPPLIILDTLADIYGGNEIVRAQVRRFIGMLRRLRIDHAATVLVLAHPSVAGMEKGTSGSTGWSNSVRSRLYLNRIHDDDGRESDEDARVLRVGKSNYGRVGFEIPMRWQAGIFVPVQTAAGGDPLIHQAKADRIFLEMLAKFMLQDRAVSVSPGANYAPKLFEPEARGQGIGKRALIAAMNRLLDAGRIINAPYGPPSRGTRRLVAV